MRRVVPLTLAGFLLILTGCGSRHQSIRPDAGEAEVKPPQRINNSESPVVERWSGGGN